MILILRGTLQLKNISYGIEPLEAVSGFVHMIYEGKNDNTNIPLLGENKTYSYNNLYYHIRRSSEVSDDFLILTYLLKLCEMKNTLRAKFNDLQILRLFYFFMKSLHDF